MIAHGTVVSARAAFVEARLPAAAIGNGVRISCARGILFGTVAAICGETITIAPHGGVSGISPGDPVCTDPFAHRAPLGMCLLGRAVDANGAPIDGKPPARGPQSGIAFCAPLPSARRPITRPFWTGIPAIDGLLTAGVGSRVGIFGAPGDGKTALLRALMRGSRSDAVVVALVGERGREAEEWLRSISARTTIVCATSDRSAIERTRAARLAMAQAAALRSRGLNVLTIVDSLARLAAAHREIAVACGESAGRAGYPPRVFAELAELCEVAGACADGAVTLFATVLNDGDDRDPVSEAARAILDGHIALSSKLAHAGMFPAIDVLRSASRTMENVVDSDRRRSAAAVRNALAALEQTADVRAAGIAPPEEIERAAERERAVYDFLYAPATGDPGQTAAALNRLAEFLERSQCSSPQS